MEVFNLKRNMKKVTASVLAFSLVFSPLHNVARADCGLNDFVCQRKELLTGNYDNESKDWNFL